MSPKQGSYALVAISPQNDTIHIGDTLSGPDLPSPRLTLNGNTVGAAFRAEVTAGSSVLRVDSVGRLIALGPGDGVLRMRPLSHGLPVDTLFLDFNLHTSVRELVSSGQDSIWSLKDTLPLTAQPRSPKHVGLSGITVRWRVESGTAVMLLDSTSSVARVVAEANGDAVLKASTDTATVTRTIHVRQKVASVIPPGAIALHAAGQARQLNPQVRDLRLNAVAGPTLTYTSRAPGVATVSSGGVVTAVADGTTRVVQTATGPGGGSAADSTTVVVQRSHLGIVSGGSQSASIGQPLAQPLVVQLLDPSGAAVADSGLRVVFRVTTGDARFAGVDSAVAFTNAQGRASALPTLGAGLAADTIQVTGAGLAGSSVTFVAQAAPPARLTIEQEPTDVKVGASITPAVRVAVRDTFGTVVTSATTSVAVAVAPGTGANGASLQGTTTQAASAGVATFSAVALDKVGTGYKLIASAAGLAPDTSVAFNVAPGAPDHLAFVVQPSGVAVNTAVTPAMQVAIQDAGNNTVASAIADVTVAFSTAPVPGAQLFGTLTATTVNGVATFSNVKIANPGAGYTLRASTALSGVRSAESNAFNVIGTPTNIVMVWGNNQNGLLSAALSPFVVKVTDAGSTPIQGDSVIFKVTAGGGKLGGQDTVIVLTDAAGQASTTLTLGSSAGTNTVTARSKSIAATTLTFNASATDPNLHLAFVTQPSNATGGVAIAPAVQVAVQDASSNTVTTATTIVTLALASGTGTAGAALGGTVQVAAVNGVATFGNLSVDKVGTGYQLAASATAVAGATSATFNVMLGAASRLSFAAAPASSTAGSSLGTIAVSVTDAGGNVVTAATNSVTLALGGGTPGANLRGTKTVSAASGVATFTGLSVDSAGTAYTLTASAGGLTAVTSGVFAIQPAPPSRLAFSAQPTDVTAGVVMTPAVAVLVQDSLGNTVTGSTAAVTLAFGSNPTGATLQGTTSVAAMNGVATFANLRIVRNGAGFTLVAAASGLTSGTSSPFQVLTGPPIRLAFTVQPGDALQGVQIGPPVQVTVQDSLGNVVPTATPSITLVITTGSGTSGAVLAGTTTVSAVSGVATFGNLSIATVGSSYKLTASASGLSSALSSAFNILVALSNRLVFTVQPTTSVVAGVALSPAVQVTAKDGSNNTVTSFTGSVTLGIPSGTGTAGAALRGTKTVNAVAGVATFTGLSVDSAGTGYTLAATASSLAGGTSAAFGVVPAPPNRLVFLVQPSSRTAGNAFAPAIQVAVLDSLGNRTTNASPSVVLAITSGTGATGAVLAGTTTQVAVNGVATFADLSIAKAGVGYTLTATSSGATSATSNSFSIIAGSLAQIVVTPAGTSIATLGGTAQFTASGLDSLGNGVSGLAFVWASLNPNVATVNVSTGTAMAVASGQATISATSGAATGYALLTVAIPGATPVNLWRRETTGTTATLSSVWGTSLTNVYTPNSQDGTTILRFDGASWSALSTGRTTPLNGVTGTSTSDVMAVGNQGVILHYNGSTWVDQSVQTAGNHLNAAWAAAPSDIWAVGGATTMQLWHYDGTAWTQTSLGAGALFGVWGTSRRKVIAVGASSGGSPAIYRFDGSAWTPMAAAGAAGLTAVWGADSNDIWSAGLGGLLLHFNGTMWSQVSSGTTQDLHAVFGSAGSDVYAVGAGGTILRYAGGSWQSISAPDSSSLLGGWASPGDPVFAAGYGGTVFRGVRGASVVVTPLSPTLTALGATVQLTATARDRVFNTVSGVTFTWTSSNPGVATVNSTTGVVTAVANGAATITATAPGGITGSQAVTVSQVAKAMAVSPAGASLSGVGATQTFTVTAQDSLGHAIANPSVTWASLNPNVATINSCTGLATAVAAGQVTISATSGTATSYALLTVAIPAATPVNLWAPMTSGTTRDLQGVWGTSATNVWAVGSGGTIRRWDGMSWAAQESGEGIVLFRVWGTSPTNAWLVGVGGTIRRWDGTSWAAQSSGGVGSSLIGIWGTSQANVYAVGRDGTILRWDGTSWAGQASGTTQHLHSVWGTSATNVWAVGTVGTIVRWDGTSWAAQASGVSFWDLEDVWGTSPTNAWAVGGGGTILRWDGTSWAAQASGTTQDLRSVWGTSPTNVYAVGYSGTVLRWDGTSWVAQTSGATGNLWGVWGTSPTNALAVGDGGTVVRGVAGATVTLAPASPTLTAAVGATQQLTVTARDAGNNAISGVTFAWTSSAPSVATVSSSGLVTAVANGTATMTATAPGGASGSTTVTVDGFALVSVGFGVHTCGVTARGVAYCWGDNIYGQLGSVTSGDQQGTPLAVSGGLVFQSVRAGGSHTCGVTTGGAAYCWGSNFEGQLGDGTTTSSNTPVAVSGGLTFASVVPGSSHTCGVTTGGAAYCWGYNYSGQLGNGTTTGSNTPVAVSGGLNFQSVSGGGSHTCGLTTSGAAYCWGYNFFGALGNGTTTSSSTPVAVSGGLTFQSVSGGGSHTCGLTTGGAAYCWGSNSFGELGNGTTTRSSAPVAVSGGLTLQSISSGEHTCGVATSGAAYCWGSNSYGKLGNGTTTDSSTPAAVSGGLTFESVSAGGSSRGHTCGVTTNGAAYCWGDNAFKELGNGTTTNSITPVPVSRP